MQAHITILGQNHENQGKIKKLKTEPFVIMTTLSQLSN